MAIYPYPMKTKYYILTLFIITGLYPRLSAQPTDYEDFYQTINTLSDEKVYSKLISYQRQDPYFANIYAQLGVVTQKLLYKTDPLKDFQQAVSWSDNGILFLGLFTHYMTENESRSNRSFYSNLPITISDSKLSNFDLVAFSKGLSARLEVYRDSLKLIYRAFEQSKKYYGRSIELYRNINNRFNSLNEALLQTDEVLINDLKRLSQLFDSTIFHFNRYKELTKSFPLKGYQQEFSLKPIKTFRLDGLTNTNFLDANFQIWDFGTWVDEYMVVYNSEIVSLREEIRSINNWFIENEKPLYERTVDIKSLPKPIFDEKFLYRLGKYDNNSLVRELLNYRNMKYKFLIDYNDELNSPSSTDLDILPRKARYYNSLRSDKKAADSLLVILDNAISPERIKRFSTFFTSFYGGQTGLKTFCDDQKNDLNKLLNYSFTYLKFFLKYQRDYFEKPSFYKYKNDSIPSIKVNPDYPGRYNSKDVFRISGEPVYIAGIDFSKNTAAPYIISVDKQKKVKWYKQLERPFTVPKDSPKPLFQKVLGYNGGCMGIYTKQNPEISNTLVKLDSTGKELFRSSIPVFAVPVFMDYDDINQRVLVALKGDAQNNLEKLESATICLTDSVGNTKWKTEFSISGNIVDIIKTEGIYQVFINYKNYKIEERIGSVDQSGTLWGAMVINIDETGKITEIVPLTQAYSYFISDVIKLSGQTICLIGYKSKPGETDATLHFSIINASGKIIYTN